jgi:hypothetical protein
MKRRGKQEHHFAVCINNEGYEASLEAGKLYRMIPDDEAISHGYIRVIDESGEDYGYSVDRFFPIEVPQALEEALTLPAKLPTEDYLQAHGARGSRVKFDRARSKVRSTKPRGADQI